MMSRFSAPHVALSSQPLPTPEAVFTLWLEELQANDRSRGTIRRYKSAVESFLQWYHEAEQRPCTWMREHNQQVKSKGKGVRILPLFLPKQSPWLNPIEPKWVHGKRAVVEPNGLLSAKQLAERICASYRCSYEAHVSLPAKVS